ncbi:MAG: 50S ribosomal protein L5 [Candidatus Wildermuthbacteria bacterium RIFCSPLOWO2_02_FULL_47_9c]|nr:MAG: 50S ribosomal protein L5 [Candidatus Wildermuthbacteria bacterium GWA1_49_26]OHA66231.1 MAG: 50S ribosomal protein L5 [Candidatus Wildermuthbacteria bacterium RIFCSPHIGHO2_01_FULL_50_47]OHA69830.1 MAG: 50S ribosomal protein L5 [Candidatus Wildermuthbacteria bacterium RIFCSPHIGHO2_02_FULL_49_17]OHA71697.1 MAG: 50S ribosomal protein L5 [Candidatus Wildermuthbacteria bacterium RIFCSPHIGHO2_12_FULL_49_13]OHA74318.1 MAG: 50S ribosomal protein L5 [Candidatus Wildermuthbacteria bacterium RIFCS
MRTMREKYAKDVVPAMIKKFGYKSVMAVPRPEKVVLNTGFGKLIAARTEDEQRKTLEAIGKDMSDIAGQRISLTRAKRSIAGFKIREGMPVGAKVTLRGARMYEFLDRLIHVVLPRSRDFRGLPVSSVDEKGNMAVGIREHIFFSEISPEKVKDIFGLQVTIATTAKSKEKGLELFRLLGFPIRGK